MAGYPVDVMRRFMEEDIPFNKHLGIKVRKLDVDEVELVLPFRPEHIGDALRGALHGGTISMLIDTAGGAAAFMHINEGEVVSTVDLVVDYLRPGPTADIVAKGRVVRKGNRVITANVVVTRADDNAADAKVIAQGRGVYNIAKPERGWG
jgi:uncharacterized protein (TIGR00369 family)